ncbi:MAG TPA: hypothetical protein EYN37_03990 [Dehalococcoidia bacterium]|nr:hypothetical protein [Dehalococcoidia bacterium]
MRQPSVILIGGPPIIGETTIARRLAARLDYGTMSTDDLGQCIRDVTTPDSHPNLHLNERDRSSRILRVAFDRAVDSGRRESTPGLMPAVEAVIRRTRTGQAPSSSRAGR